MLKLSVIIPAYNERDTILAVLETVRSQSVDGVAIEVIVDENVVRDIIPQLKKIGAEGIIEYPLNKVIY